MVKDSTLSNVQQCVKYALGVVLTLLDWRILIKEV